MEQGFSMASKESRERLLIKAMLCERAEMFDEMKDVMKEIAMIDGDADFNDDERKMLSNAYKSVIGKKRASWRKIASLGAQVDEENPKKLYIKKYMANVEGELNDVCRELLALLEEYLLPKVQTLVSKIFFLKMKADHFRYLVEIAPEDTALKEQSREAYEQATSLSEEKLEPANPVRLGLALNHSVFVYEIDGCTDKAYEMAERAFKDGLSELKKTEDVSEDATTMLQLLRDNLTYWGEEQ